MVLSFFKTPLTQAITLKKVGVLLFLTPALALALPNHLGPLDFINDSKSKSDSKDRRASQEPQKTESPKSDNKESEASENSVSEKNSTEEELSLLKLDELRLIQELWLIEKKIKNPNEDIRVKAVIEASKVTSRLLQINSSEQSIREQTSFFENTLITSCCATSNYKAAIELIKLALTDSSSRVRAQAITEMAKFDEFVSHLTPMDFIRDSKDEKRDEKNSQKSIEEKLSILEQAMIYASTYERIQSLELASSLGKEGLRFIEQGIKDPSEEVRIKAVIEVSKVMAMYHRPPKRATIIKDALVIKKGVDLMEQALTDTNLRVRLQVITEISKFEVLAYPILNKIMKKGEAPLRKHAIYSSLKHETLGSFILNKAIKDSDISVRLYTLEALKDFKGDRLPIFLKALKDKEVSVRLKVVENAYVFEIEAPSILDKEIQDKLWKDPKERVKKRVQWNLKLGLEDDLFIILEKALKDPNPSVRSEATKVYSEIQDHLVSESHPKKTNCKDSF